LGLTAEVETSLILPTEPNECELNSIRHDPDRLAEIPRRLSDISWWRRVLCQRIAIRANHDDGESGKFWQSRFRAVRLMGEESLLACAAYVDLNPIRAAMAETLEQSDHTSVQRRIEAKGEKIGRQKGPRTSFLRGGARRWLDRPGHPRLAMRSCRRWNWTSGRVNWERAAIGRGPAAATKGFWRCPWRSTWSCWIGPPARRCRANAVRHPRRLRPFRRA